MVSFITFRTTLLKTMLVVSKLTPSAKQKWTCMQERIKIVQQRKKQVKFDNIHKSERYIRASITR
jgi:hypothetical protein